jgi:ribosomal protein S18 acetylase RimI-like enzyme
VSSIVADYVQPPASGSFYLNNLAVDANFRGRGIGCDLLREACARAQESGYQQVELDVASTNAGAIRLYRACDFEDISRSEACENWQKYSLPPLLRMCKNL